MLSLNSYASPNRHILCAKHIRVHFTSRECKEEKRQDTTKGLYCRFQSNETTFRYVQKSASPKLIDEAIKQQQTHIRNSASNQVQKRAKRAVIAINTNAPRPTDQACSEWNRGPEREEKQAGGRVEFRVWRSSTRIRVWRSSSGI